MGDRGSGSRTSGTHLCIGHLLARMEVELPIRPSTAAHARGRRADGDGRQPNTGVTRLRLPDGRCAAHRNLDGKLECFGESEQQDYLGYYAGSANSLDATEISRRQELPTVRWSDSIRRIAARRFTGGSYASERGEEARWARWELPVVSRRRTSPSCSAPRPRDPLTVCPGIRVIFPRWPSQTAWYPARSSTAW